MAYIAYSTARSASAMAGAQDLLAQTVSNFADWNQARRTRAALLKLSAHELEDIGLNRADIDKIAVQGRF